ncbi:hypothetical protein NHX12_033510 [Muraenolepis orangiensis]|uniref:Uncharacterized protein n=1 Tax=Muraenolepis orangiensis TaxID=630683 RepID=A0A9Q0E584_9TELE|nr:hypothetical protein NHX12_033510 [Muraenolepis orangiensis]
MTSSTIVFFPHGPSLSILSGNSFCSDPLVFMGDLGDMIDGEFQLREAQEQRRLEEHEYQSIRLELVIGYRQTLADLQTGNRRAEKKAQLRSAIGEMLHMTKGVAPGKVGGQETEEEKISILIDQLNKDILVSTKHLSSSMDLLIDF